MGSDGKVELAETVLEGLKSLEGYIGKLELWPDRTGGFRAKVCSFQGAGGTPQIALVNALEGYYGAYPDRRPKKDA